MRDNFESALEHVLVHEGGYVDHPDDPGGATNKGVTLAVFRRYYGAERSKDDLRNISEEQVRHIYKSGYWDRCRCDELPDGVDYVVFDQAVNSGPGRSVRWLQEAVGSAVDGAIGPQTVSSAVAADAADTVNAMCDTRLDFLRTLSHWPTFGRGWSSRVAGVRSRGLAMTGAAVEPAPSAAVETVRQGSRGEWVSRLQEALGVEADGVFGPGTERALKQFQESVGLEPDGVAGRMTYRALGLIQ